LVTVGEQHKDNRIVVVDIGGQDIRVVGDAVTDVLRIPAGAIEPPSSVITTADSEYLLGIAKLDDKMIILLELESVLSEKEKDLLLEDSLAVG